MTLSCDIPAGFPIDVTYWKVAVMVTIGNHVIVGCSDLCNCVPVTKCPNCDHVTTGTLQWPRLGGPVANLIQDH